MGQLVPGVKKSKGKTLGMQPSIGALPGFIQANLQQLAGGSNTAPHELLLFHLTHSIAILNAGALLCGEPLVNPFIDFNQGFITNWEELYLWLRYEYERLFMASGLLEDKSEQTGNP